MEELDDIKKMIPSALLAIVGFFAFIWGFSLIVALIC